MTTAPATRPELPRFVTTIVTGDVDRLLVAIPTRGRRTLTRTLRRADDETRDAFLARVTRWRDRAWWRVHGEPVPERSFHQNARITSKTGIPGVRLLDKTVRKGGRTYVVPVVLAEVHTIPGKDYERPHGSRSRLFSLNIYPLDEAITLAAAWRMQALKALEAGLPVPR